MSISNHWEKQKIIEKKEWKKKTTNKDEKRNLYKNCTLRISEVEKYKVPKRMTIEQIKFEHGEISDNKMNKKKIQKSTTTTTTREKIVTAKVESNKAKQTKKEKKNTETEQDIRIIGRKNSISCSKTGKWIEKTTSKKKGER